MGNTFRGYYWTIEPRYWLYKRNSTEEEMKLTAIKTTNDDPTITGIIVPKNQRSAIKTISPAEPLKCSSKS